MNRNPFSDGEIDARLARFRAFLAEARLDAAVLSSPENVFYFTGLDHWGYFAPHLLIVPLERRPVLVTRAMEVVAVETMVRSADFRGHGEDESAADVAADALRDLGLAGRRLGFEAWAAGLSYGLGCALQAQAAADWRDISGAVDRLRRVKSPEELALVRRAAGVTDAATQAAVAAIGDGVPEREVAAACLAATLAALKPGRTAHEVYSAWQHTVDEAGLAHYRRHHCGYLVGIAFPPSWTGGNTVTGLRRGSDLLIEAGMTFHLMSWLMGTGQGDFCLTNCVLLGAGGPEVLTTGKAVPIC